MILQGGDALLRMLLFWAMFLPLGAYYSVDAALQKQPHTERFILSWGTVAILVQVGIVYWFTTALKQGIQWIPDGTAVYYALMIDQFVTPFGLWLRQFPLVMQGLTYFVFALEFSALWLLFPVVKTVRIRTVGIVLLLLMHLGFSVSLSLGLFPFVDMLAILLFVPGDFWDWIGEKLKKPGAESLRLYHDSDCGFCTKMAHIIIVFLGFSPDVSRAAQSEHYLYTLMKQHHSWIVVAPTGEVCYEFRAFVVLCRYSPLFFWLAPLLSVSFVHAIGTKSYALVRNHRSYLSRMSALFFPYQQVRFSLGIFFSGIVLMCLSLVLWWNIADMVQTTSKILPIVRATVLTLHLDQKWNMFAPYPRTDDGWYVIEGVLKDGTVVDVFHGREEQPSYEKPALVSAEYKNRYWRKYLMSLSSQQYIQRRLYYGQYLCRTWNIQATGDKQLATFRIYFFQETTKDDYRVQEPTQRQLWRHDCFSTDL